MEPGTSTNDEQTCYIQLKPNTAAVIDADTDLNSKYNRCGILNWRPQCLEPLKDIRAFIAATCFISCLQAAFSGYTSSQITTVEKRFAIGSILIGVISSSFEVGYISCVMIVSYAGSKGRVPLWISSGLLAMGIGAFIYSAPQFILPQSTFLGQMSIDQICYESFTTNLNNSGTSVGCIKKGVQGYYFMPIFIFAQFLIGAGSSPILTLAPPYIDDHVPNIKAPAMIASIYAAAALGPVFGYALGTLMLQYPADILSSNPTTPRDITSTDVDWIGAWWAGYVVLGSGVIIGAFILGLFPRRLNSNFDHSYPLNTSLDQIDSAICVVDLDCPNLGDGNLSTVGNQSMKDNHRTSSGVTNNMGNVNHNYLSSTIKHFSVSGLVSAVNNSPLFFQPCYHRHSRSSGGGSMMLQAAVTAATAAHLDDEVENSNCYCENENTNFYTPFQHWEPHLNDKGLRMSIQSHDHQFYPDTTYVKHNGGPASTCDDCHPKSSFRHKARNHSVSSQYFSGNSRGYRSKLTHSPLHCSLKLYHKELATYKPWISSSSVHSTVPPYPTQISLSNQETREHTPITPLMQNLIENSLSEEEDTPLKPDMQLPLDSESEAIQFNNVVDTSTSKPEDVAYIKINKKSIKKRILGRSYGFIQNWTNDIPRSIFGLLKNKIYVVTCLCICFEMFVIIGFAGFLPKYLEIEYQISKAEASMIAGGLIVPAGALGILVGGLILNKAHLRRRSAIIFVLVVNCIISACMGTFFFLGCDNPKIAGFTSPYPTQNQHNHAPIIYDSHITLNVTCLSSCSCDLNKWTPVCHPKSGVTFFSACHAGCKTGPLKLANGKSKIFTDCSCLADFVPLVTDSTPGKILPNEVQLGRCPLPCNTLIPFVCLLTIALFLTGVIQNPLLMVTMRSVGHNERSLALGLQFVIVRLLANLPSPIAFGRVIDAACLNWRNECGRRGDCAFTDLIFLTFYIAGLGTIIKGGSLFVYMLLIYLLPYSTPSPSLTGINNTHSTPIHKVSNKNENRNNQTGCTFAEINTSLNSLHVTARDSVDNLSLCEN